MQADLRAAPGCLNFQLGVFLQEIDFSDVEYN